MLLSLSRFVPRLFPIKIAYVEFSSLYFILSTLLEDVLDYDIGPT